ncbi:MAG: glycosyltransferase family 2 protein [Pirellulales bacterium]|nr:glycosyltransferase family 2 protein [Pirellulales bacterium]
MSVRLSIVMPAYNEEGAIERAVVEVQERIFSHVPDAELIVVDDGSRDRTGAILDRLARDEPRLRVVHQANGGHGPALRHGLDLMHGSFVLLVDSDRQIPLDHFAEFWQEIAGCDAVIGVRRVRHDPRIRLYLTRLVRWTIRVMFGVSLADANVPFKLVRGEAWQAARCIIPPDTLTPSMFLAVFLKRAGYRVSEREVCHRERQTGIISIRRWKLLRFCFRGFRQLLAFRRRLGAWKPGHAC